MTDTIGPALIEQMNESMDFIVGNLNDQYIIPMFTDGFHCESHTKIQGFESQFTCNIVVTNVKYGLTDYISQDYGDALGVMASIIVQDHLESDCFNPSGIYKESIGRTPPRTYFIRNYTHTITKTLEINGETFKINLTFERKYIRTD